MHLHGLPDGQPGRTFSLNQKAASSKVGDGENRVQAEAATRTDSGHAASSEVIRLAERLNRIPDTREQVIANAVERFNSGYYLTQEAADQTADRLAGE